MLCLGIESSCDETAFALVRDGKLLGQTLRSQVDLHALFGGVVPELASREHGRIAGSLYDLLLQECGVRVAEIDAIAVARGPGLLGSLLVGVSFAKALALSLGKPVVGVNHLHAHLLAAGLDEALVFPALGLLVSGGHTHIYYIKSPVDFTLLGKSLDDAAGEALDKFGKLLGLPYPAGKFIDEFGSGAVAEPGMFPRPYLDNDNFDFSFSGLKTAAALYLKGRPHLRFELERDADEDMRRPVPCGNAGDELATVCASFQLSVAETLRVKLERALDFVQAGSQDNPASVVLAGGVAANSVVRAALRGMAVKRKLPLVIPSPKLCTDNAAMVAYAGYLLRGMGLRHSLDFSAIPRGQQVPDDYLDDLSYTSAAIATGEMQLLTSF